MNGEVPIPIQPTWDRNIGDEKLGRYKTRTKTKTTDHQARPSQEKHFITPT